MKILATSRELLSIPGEFTFGVPPLSLADDEAEGDAAALFLERVEDHTPFTEVTAEQKETVHRICRALDGLPLAIELAAARTRTLSFDEVERRLSDRFALLAGGSRIAPARQRTLRATMDWSYDLLTDAEKRLFGALSVVPGTFAADAAEAAVAAGGGEEAALDLLSALVDKSLVARTGDSYYLLPTLRRYAAERVDGEMLPMVRKALVGHFAAMVTDLEKRLLATEEGDGERRLGEERSNLRSALAWAMETGDTEAALGLAAALALHWTRSGVWTEGWLHRATSAGDDVPQTIQLQEGLLLLEGITEPADALASLAQLVEGSGEDERATRLLAAADLVRQDQGQEIRQPVIDLAIRLEAKLGGEAFGKAWGDGRTLAGGS